MNPCRTLLLSLTATLLLAAPCAAGQFQVREIKVGEQKITVVIYKGQSYRRVTFDDFTDARLVNQLVCMEGKLKKTLADRVLIFGSKHRFKAGSPELFRKLVPGDNVWIGGRLARSGVKLVFNISVAVKLKTDLELFEERFKAAGKEGDWKRLLELAAWIDKSKDYNPKIDFAKHRRYRTCKSRAIAKACTSAEKEFGDKNAVGYADLAKRILKLGADRELAYGYMRRAASIDPELVVAVEGLSAAGFVKWRGLWVTKEEKKRLAAEEREYLTKRVATVKARRERRGESAVMGAVNYARDLTEMERSLAPLKGAEAAERLASEIERAAGPRLGRRALALAAALPVKLQKKPIGAAMRSTDAQVRIAALELVSVRKDLAARKILVTAAGGDGSEEVTELACNRLAAAADAHAIEALVGLVESTKKFRARAAVQALRRITGQDRFTKAEWDKWWSANKRSYPPGPTK
jgi:hypothetical protein